MVLKRCIYGVDKNPLTVELAKVSLWLHSFTVGTPLSFLDHHLRCGDSLVGLSVTEATAELNRLGGLFASSAIAGAEAATAGMQRIEEMSDADISEVQESASLFRGVEDTTADVRGLLDFLCGLRWMTAGMKEKVRTSFESQIVDTLGRWPDHAYELLARGPLSEPGFMGLKDGQDSGFSRDWNDARAIADRERFLHWQVAFPGVWQGWQDANPKGGFDAVIGNPPWDRIKLQEVEWFATRKPEIALATTAAARREGVRKLRKAGDPLVDDFDDAWKQADKMGQLVRTSGHYPLLGRGDINLYSLFVERAMGLVKPDGDRGIGSLRPASTRTGQRRGSSSRSPRRGACRPYSISRIDGLGQICRRSSPTLTASVQVLRVDFRRCGAPVRRNGVRVLHALVPKQSRDPERCFPLAPEDFARVNPNTGTAPVFRTSNGMLRLTREIYERTSRAGGQVGW